MFGYVKPCKGELKVREYEDYNAMYCGLCHVLSKRYGPWMRFILNYDMSFLALTLSSAVHCDCIKCGKRCIASPFKKKAYILENDALSFSADANVILTYWKLKDGILDEPFWKKILLWFLLLLMTPAYHKAKKYRPDFAIACKNGLTALREVEKAQTPSVDAAADTFARIIAHASHFSDDPTMDRTLNVLFYHIGRWVYILDAWDDMSDDRKKGNYNPILLRYEIKEDTNLSEIRQAVAETLEHSAATAAGAAELIAFDANDSIIKNVLYLGLPMTANTVLSGKKNQRRNINGSL